MSLAFDLPIVLALSANATIFGEELSVQPYDYLLVDSWENDTTESTRLFSLSALSLGQVIQYSDLTSNTNPDYRINGDAYTYLSGAINQLVKDKDLKLIAGPDAKPTQYPNAATGPVPEPLGGHYTQYLASILFGHPLARAPIRNEDGMYSTMYGQNLGPQFVGALSANNYSVVHAIFEQFLANESTENRLSVADSAQDIHLSVSSQWKNMPFHSGDTISFVVQMQGSVAVDSTNAGTGSVVVPFSSIYAGGNGIDNAGVVSAKKWLVRLTLDA